MATDSAVIVITPESEDQDAQARLRELEAQVQDFADAMTTAAQSGGRAGQALYEIRMDKLYLAYTVPAPTDDDPDATAPMYPTFRAYIEDRWQVTFSRISQLIGEENRRRVAANAEGEDWEIDASFRPRASGLHSVSASRYAKRVINQMDKALADYANRLDSISDEDADAIKLCKKGVASLRKSWAKDRVTFLSALTDEDAETVDTVDESDAGTVNVTPTNGDDS